MDKSMLYVTGIVVLAYVLIWIDIRINGRVDKDE